MQGFRQKKDLREWPWKHECLLESDPGHISSNNEFLRRKCLESVVQKLLSLILINLPSSVSASLVNDPSWGVKGGIRVLHHFSKLIDSY